MKSQDKNTFSIDRAWRRQNTWEQIWNDYRLSFNKERSFGKAQIQLSKHTHTHTHTHVVNLSQSANEEGGETRGV